jgi:hypothetical protein
MASFDGGKISSDAGALLPGATDRAIYVVALISVCAVRIIDEVKASSASSDCAQNARDAIPAPSLGNASVEVSRIARCAART